MRTGKRRKDELRLPSLESTEKEILVGRGERKEFGHLAQAEDVRHGEVARNNARKRAL